MTRRESGRTMNLVLAVLSAPGRWMERSRGLSQLAFGLAAFLLMMLCALWIRHAASLNGLPNIAEPFDVAALRVSRPADADNAFALYRKAVAEIPPETIEQVLLAQNDHPFPSDSYLQQIATSYRSALALFHQAANRPDALADDPSTLPGVFALSKLSLAEGGRLEKEGDLAGAWEHYRPALRASRHLGQRAGWAGRSLGLSLHEDACNRVIDWANRPKMDHDLLKTAITDLESLDALTPPAWLTMRYEYLATLERLASSPPGQPRPELRDSRAFDAFLRNEPERSRRILRLIFANWLAEWTLPASSRPHKVIEGTPSLYLNPASPRDARRLPPARLQEWYASSDLDAWDPPLVDLASPRVEESLLDESILRANLIVYLAERRYLLDHKELPTFPEGLLGLYLNRIPPAYLPSRSLRFPLDLENDLPALDTTPAFP